MNGRNGGGAVEGIVVDLGELLGFLSASPSGVDYESDWFGNPWEETAGMFARQRSVEAMRRLLGTLFPESAKHGGPRSTWYSLGQENLFLVLEERAGGRLNETGFGFAFDIHETVGSQNPATFSAEVFLPILTAYGVPANPETSAADILFGQADSPLTIRLRIDLADRAELSGVSFSSVEVAAALSLTHADIDLAILDFQESTSEAPRELRISSLEDAGAATVDALLSMLINTLPAGSPVFDHLLPLLGMRGVDVHGIPFAGNAWPSLVWTSLTEGGDGVRDWFAGLLDRRDPAGRPFVLHWLEHLASLFAGVTVTGANGAGSVDEPWSVGVPLGAADVSFNPVVAVFTDAAGTRWCRLGVSIERLGPSGWPFESRLSVRTWVADVPIEGEGSARLLPSLTALVEIFGAESGGTRLPLLVHAFAPGNDPAGLGTLSLGRMVAGFRLTAERTLEPVVELRQVSSSALGDWERVDLTNARTPFDLAQAALDQLAARLAALLDGAGPAGQWFGALLGLHGPPDTSGWPRLDLFEAITDPLGAFADYHTGLLDAVVDGEAAWKHILRGLASLLRGPNVPPDPDVAGVGTRQAPWRVPLCLPAAGEEAPAAYLEVARWRDEGNRWHLALSLDATLARVGLVPGCGLDAGLDARLVEVRYPTAAQPLTFEVLGGGGARLRFQAAGPGPATALADDEDGRLLIDDRSSYYYRFSIGPVQGLSLQLEGIEARLGWSRQAGAGWSLRLQNPRAVLTGPDPFGQVGEPVVLAALQLPDVDFPEAAATWDVASWLADGSVETAQLGPLLSALLGDAALENAGPWGLAAALLLGLPPDAAGFDLAARVAARWPGVSLPPWSFPHDPERLLPGRATFGSGPYSLPPDWPVLEARSFRELLSDPIGTANAHLGRVLTGVATSGEPFALPFLRLLGGWLRGVLPDLRRTNLGWATGSQWPAGTPVAIPGRGSYRDPFVLSLDAAGALEVAVWADPEGLATATVVEIALAAAPPALREVMEQLGGVGAEPDSAAVGWGEIVDLMIALGSVDPDLGSGYRTRSAAAVAQGLQELEALLWDTDGLATEASQSGWSGGLVTTANLPGPGHRGLLDDASAARAVWETYRASTTPANAAMLLLAPPYLEVAAWDFFLDRFETLDGRNGVLPADRCSAHFDFRAGLAAAQYDLSTVTATEEVYTAALGLRDGVGADETWQDLVAQVEHTVERIRELRPGALVVLVGHGMAGLAARRYARTAGAAARLAGLVTLASPHGGVATTGGPSLTAWLAGGGGDVLRLLERIDARGADATGAADRRGERSTAGLGTLLGPCLEILDGFRPAPADGLPSPSALGRCVALMAGAAPPGAAPAGLPVTQLTTRLTGGLKHHVLLALRQRIGAARGRAPAAPSHAGVGLRYRLPGLGVEANGVDCRARLCVDLAAFRSPAAQTAGRGAGFAVQLEFTRPDGWLVGGPDDAVRARWMELEFGWWRTGGFRFGAAVHDAGWNGFSAAHLAASSQFDGRPAFEDSHLAELLDEGLRAASTGAAPNGAATKIALLLEQLGIATRSGSAWVFSADALRTAIDAPAGLWADRFADPFGDWNLLSVMQWFAGAPEFANSADPLTGFRFPLPWRGLEFGLRWDGTVTLTMPARDGGGLTVELDLAVRLPNGLLVADARISPESPPGAAEGPFSSWSLELHADAEAGAPPTVALRLPGLSAYPIPGVAPETPVWPAGPAVFDRLIRLAPVLLLDRLTSLAAQRILLDDPTLRSVLGRVCAGFGLAHSLDNGQNWWFGSAAALFIDPARFLRGRFLDSRSRPAPGPLLALGRQLAAFPQPAPTSGPARITVGTSVEVYLDAAVQSFTLGAAMVPGQRIALPGAALLDVAGDLTWRDGELRPGGAVNLTLPLGPDWSVTASPSLAGGAFRLRASLARTGAQPFTLDLYPRFGGWAQLFVGVAYLLPELLNGVLRAIAEEPGAGWATVQQQIVRGVLWPLADATQLSQAPVSSPGALQLAPAQVTSLAADPAVWLRTNATAFGGAAARLLAEVFGLGASGDAVTLPLGSGFSLLAGVDSTGGVARAGVWLSAAGLPFGAVQLVEVQLGAALETASGRTAARVQVNLSLADPLPVGLPLQPGIFFRFEEGAAEPIRVAVATQPFPLDYPQNEAGVVIRFLPTPVAVSGDVVALLGSAVLPLALETLTDGLQEWLASPLLDSGPQGLQDALRPGEILQAMGVLVRDGAVYRLPSVGGQVDFAALQALTPESLLLGLLRHVLETAATLAAAHPLVDTRAPGEWGYALFLEGVGSRWGLRMIFDDLVFGSDVEVVLELAGDVAWTGESDLPPGLTLLFLDLSGTPAPILEVILGGVGMELRRAGGTPLLDFDFFSIGGFHAQTMLQLPLLRPQLPPPAIEFGGRLELSDLAIALGGGGDGGNPMASGMIGGAKPGFDVAVAYWKGFSLELGDGGHEVWFPINRKFGPLEIDQIGVLYSADPDGSNQRLGFSLDASLQLGPLLAQVDELTVRFPLADPGNLGEWRIDLKGLAISYDGGIRLTGALQKADVPEGVEYRGLCLVEVAGYTFTGIGAFGELGQGAQRYKTLFVFISLPITIGGPPFLFITGLAGGFGYNRDIVVPENMALIPDFSLLRAARGDLSGDPLEVLEDFGTYVPPRRGALWVAGGLRFTTFALVQSTAVAYLKLGGGLEIGVVGISEMKLPSAESALVSIELALKVRFSTAEGLLSVQAQLTDNSWLFNPSCRLTGGFAFIIWFRRGEFLLSLGGYHPAFQKPLDEHGRSYYPDIPRLGFHWEPFSALVLKGGSYFALTSSAVMGGGELSATFDVDWARAWFYLGVHVLVSWDPVYYDFLIEISIGAAVDTPLGEVRLECGARVHIWGPALRGTVTVEYYLLSLSVDFGAHGDAIAAQDPLPWTDFLQKHILQDPDLTVEAGLLSAHVVQGRIGEGETESDGTEGTAARPWRVLPELELVVETKFPAERVTTSAGPARMGQLSDPELRWERPGVVELQIVPMFVDRVDSVLTLSIGRATGGDHTARAEIDAVAQNVADALWRWKGTINGTPAASNDASYLAAFTGARIRLYADPAPDPVVLSLHERDCGKRPLPFAEAAARNAAFAAADERVTAGESIAGAIVERPELTPQQRRQRAATGGRILETQVSERTRRSRTRTPGTRTLLAGMGIRTEPGPVLPEGAAPSAEPPPPPARKGAEPRPMLPDLRLSWLAPLVDPAATTRRITAPRAAPGKGPAGAALGRDDGSRPPVAGQGVRTLRQRSLLRRRAAAGTTEGVALRSGEVQLWTFPDRGVDRGADPRHRPALAISGDQPVRVIFQTSMGLTIEDRTVLPGAGTQRLAVPPSTGQVALQGLGNTARATNGAGFDAGSTLVRLGPLTYLGYGCTVRTTRLHLSGSREQATGTVRGRDLLDGRGPLAVLLAQPAGTLVVLEDGDGEPARIEVQPAGAEAFREEVVRGHRHARLWTLSATPDRPLSLTLLPGSGRALRGIACLSGSPEEWLKTLRSTGDWWLVGELAGGGQGLARVRWAPPREDPRAGREGLPDGGGGSGVMRRPPLAAAAPPLTAAGREMMRRPPGAAAPESDRMRPPPADASRPARAGGAPGAPPRPQTEGTKPSAGTPPRPKPPENRR